MYKPAIGSAVIIALLIACGGCRPAKEARTGKPQIVTTRTGIEMVSIPEGWFEMGGKDGTADEQPVHRVWVSAFLIDRYEVTQRLYARYPIPDPSHFKDPNHPVEQMTWADAAVYCNERSREEGLEPCYDEETWQCNFNANGYRLPTEAEWEYACRAGTSTEYYFGSDQRQLKSHAWFSDNLSGRTHPVGRKKPNPWGLYDMYGNVAEWCNEFYESDYYQKSPGENPKGPAQGEERVLREGAWNSSAETCRSAYRVGNPSINDLCLASDAVRFRCVRSIDGGSK